MIPTAFHLSAISGSPRDLSARDTSSTTIDLQWDDINCLDRNTEITGYIVRYGPTTSNDRAQVTASGDGIWATAISRFTLTGLSPYTSYSIEVAGNSDFGHGPFSDPIFQITDEACEYTVICLLSIALYC